MSAFATGQGIAAALLRDHGTCAFDVARAQLDQAMSRRCMAQIDLLTEACLDLLANPLIRMREG